MSDQESSPSNKSVWDPQQYGRFQGERSKPFFDLLSGVVPQDGMRVVDLGCGTGELTRLLHLQMHAIETVGLDNSETMLARSWSHAGDGLRFQLGDLAEFHAPGHYDLVFSNAALQWVSSHRQLLARLVDSLAEGGQLAVQMPFNQDHPSHQVAAEVAEESPFAEALAGRARRKPVLEPWEYAEILHNLGLSSQRVEVRVYGHLLAGPEEVVEWVKGTLLTHYRRYLPPELYEGFVMRYGEALLKRLPESRPYFYPFQRLLFWAHK